MQKNDIVPKPMTDDDVAMMVKKTANADAKVLNTVYIDFSHAINRLLVKSRKILDDDEDEDEIVEIERLKRLINLLPIDEKFIRCYEKIWLARDYIETKNSDYFLNKDYSSVIKKDSKQKMMETIISAIKTKYTELPANDKQYFWAEATNLLNCVKRFRKLMGDL